MNQSSFNPESMLKGRMAETLFEELMKKSGNVVYRFGYEAVLQNLVQLEKKFDGHNNEVGEKLRSIPDFIVIDKNGRPEFVEVKFRWNSEPHDDDHAKIERINKLWSPKLVLLSCKERPYFRISCPPYIASDRKFITKPLLEESNWMISHKAYEECESLIDKYLRHILTSPQN